jgi:hypothetical protein
VSHRFVVQPGGMSLALFEEKTKFQVAAKKAQ